MGCGFFGSDWSPTGGGSGTLFEKQTNGESGIHTAQSQYFSPLNIDVFRTKKFACSTALFYFTLKIYSIQQAWGILG